MRALLLLMFTLMCMGMFAVPAVAQTHTYDLAPGEKIVDSDGRTVENKGATGSGKVRITFNGTKSGSEQNIEITGKITLIRNPASGGASGPIEINTTGDATTIDLDKDGQDGSPVNVTVTGGNTTITVDGDNNYLTVGGTGNEITFNGDNNSGDGADVGSSGNVYINYGATGCTWGGTGTFEVHGPG